MKNIFSCFQRLNKKAPALTAGFIAVSLLVAEPSFALLTYYTNQAAFQAAAPPLLTEDFQAGNVAPASVQACIEPVDINSNNTCFSPGDIQPGLEIRSSSGTNTAIIGAGFLGVGNASIVAGADLLLDSTDVIFTYNYVYAAGMDFSDFNYPSVFNINIYNPGGGLIGSTTVNVTASDTSWGVVSSSDAIARINIESTGAGFGELCDNIQFGPPLSSIPTMTEWGMIIFMALAGLAAVYYLRTRRFTCRRHAGLRRKRIES